MEQAPEIELTPHQRFSVSMIVSDLRFVTKALTQDSWLAVAHLPYAVLVAYESERYLSKKTEIRLPEPDWPKDELTAVRMNFKIFDDTKRTARDILEGYGAAVSAHHEVFYPKKRLRWVDWLRSDTSVACLDGHPVQNSVGFGLMVGVKPSLHDSETARYMHAVARGIGQWASNFGITIDDPHGADPVPLASLTVHDVKSHELAAQSFAGMASPALSSVLFTMAGGVGMARRTAHGSCCALCALSALKRKFVVAYHAALSLKILVEDPDLDLGNNLRHRLREILDGTASRLLTPGCTRLRRGFVHYGIEDVPSSASNVVSLDDVMGEYLGMCASDAVVEISNAVDAFDDEFSAWMLASPTGDPWLSRVLGRPVLRGDE